jgi:hypothetical protein
MVLGQDLAKKVCHFVVNRYLHYYMDEDLTVAIHVLNLLFPLLETIDPSLVSHLNR